MHEIVIDRPEKYNGFTPEMLQQLSEAMAAYEADADAWCALIRAEGKHFTAGLQLDRFDITTSLIEDGAVDPLRLRAPRPSKPVVAAVKGICFTIGIELMLACDLVVAADDTRFGQIEVRRGLMPFGGATMRLVERAALAVQETRRSAQIFLEEGHAAAVAAFSGQLEGLAASEDFAEGVRSFIERRDGIFRGR